MLAAGWASWLEPLGLYDTMLGPSALGPHRLLPNGIVLAPNIRLLITAFMIQMHKNGAVAYLLGCEALIPQPLTQLTVQPAILHLFIETIDRF